MTSVLAVCSTKIEEIPETHVDSDVKEQSLLCEHENIEDIDPVLKTLECTERYEEVEREQEKEKENVPEKEPEKEPEREPETEIEAEFDPLLFIKRLPKLSDVVPSGRPHLLPKQTRSCPPVTLVLDLDGKKL